MLNDRLLIFTVSATDAAALPLSNLSSIDLVDADTIRFGFTGGTTGDGTAKSTLVTCDITSGTYLATLKELADHFYAQGSMKQPFLDVAGATAAASISNITACTAIAFDQ
mgnify:FL=1|tara:strand:+ start:460 stop:789 length:330 start_codon:yes stop_codon:yes gene_type:complete